MTNRIDKWKEKRAEIERQNLEIKPIPEQLKEVFGYREVNYLTEVQRDLIAIELVKQNMRNKVIGEDISYNDYLTEFIHRFNIARNDVEEKDKELNRDE